MATKIPSQESTEIDDLLRLVASACGFPVVTLNQVRDDQILVVASFGIPSNEAPRWDTLCREVLAKGKLSLRKARISQKADPASFAGLCACAPLKSEFEGAGLVLCLWDTDRERRVTSEQRHSVLAAQRQLRRLLERTSSETAMWEASFRHNHTGLAIGSTDLRTFARVNPAFAAERGYTPEELVGQPITMVFPPEELPELARQIETISRTGKLTFESVNRRKDGSCFPVLIVSALVHDGVGRPYRIATTVDISRQKEVEAVLRDREQQLEAMLRAQPDKIFRFDAEARYLEAFCPPDDEFYLPKPDFLGKHVGEVLPPEMAKRVAGGVGRCLETGNMQTVEISLKYQDGPRILEARMVRMNDREVFTVCRNISEQREVEQSLRQREQEIRAILTALPDLVFRFDEEGRYLDVYVADEAELLAPPASSLPGKRLRDVVTAKVARHYERAIRRCLQTGESERLEYQLNYPEGIRYFDARMVRQSESTVLVVVRNMTAHWQLEQRLHELGRAVELTDDAVYLINPKGAFLWVNPAFEKLTGYPAAEVIGTSHAGLAVGDLGQDWEEFLATLRSGRVFRSVSAKRTRDGRKVYCDETVTPLLDESGKLDRYLGIFRDVTELKATEEALRQSERRLRSLTVRMNTMREEEDKRIAMELHDELGQDLTAIALGLSSLQLIIGKMQDPQVPLLMERSEELSEMISTTVREVRRLCTELRPRILDELGLVAALEWMVQEFQRRSKIATELVLPSVPFAITEDAASAIFRVTQELLTNVGRHSQATHVHVELCRRARTLVLKVLDNGRGISPADRVRLDAYGILGMEERVRSVGGTFLTYGVEGRGTTTSISIPLLPK